MAAITGTSGKDYIEVPGSGDFEVSGGAGDDTIAVRKQAYQPGFVTVDGGDGTDTLILQVYGTQSVTVHGGAGADTFDLISGGLVYGDAGADVFQLSALAGLGRPFTIGDFSSDDRLDLTPFLKLGTGWVQDTNPFTTGFARLAQLGSDTIVQVKWANSWTTFGVIANQDATKLTTAQLGFAPSIETPSFVSVSLDRTSVTEGGKVVVTLSLSAPATKPVLVNIAPLNFTAAIAAGQTKFQTTLYLDDDAIGHGDSPMSLSMTVSDGAFADPRLTPVTLTVIDNDANGFSVSRPDSATAAYRNLTLLDPVGSAGVGGLPLPSPQQTTRDFVRALEPFALSTTSVALTAYQFFTGKSPSQAGLTYLVNSPDNASDLNDAAGAYAGMNTENRYINFAANLGLVGEGKDAFSAGYKALTFRQAVDKAYDLVIGKAAARAAGVDVDAAINGVVAAQGYFDTLANERMGGFDHDLAVKAGMVGYLIVEGQKAHIGAYARAVENFYLDLTDGTAQHNVDLVAVYGPGTFLDAM